MRHFLILAQVFTISHSLYRTKDVYSCFVLHSNEFLEKSGNVLIENVDDVEECLRQCMHAPTNHKIKCHTAMFNVNTQNCVLSKYTRDERKIKTSKGLQIDLYENNCLNEVEPVRLGIFAEQFRTTESPLAVKSRLPTVPQNTVSQPQQRKSLELRRVHAVKQYQLEQKREPVYSKTVRSLSVHNGGGRARLFAPRPLVDSSSLYRRQQRSDLILNDDTNYATCFRKTANYVFTKFEELKFTGFTLENCIRQCVHTQQLYCASINYSFNLKTCILNGGNLHLNSEPLIQSRDFDYYENICQPKTNSIPKSSTTSVTASTKKECYRLYNNSVYNSFDATIVGGLNDLESCESECSWSHIRRREKCVAVNWVTTTKGCMLFHKTIDYNFLQPSFKSIFLVNTCSSDLEQPVARTKSETDYYDQ
ncbi:unnamed protein product [Caenorhabditis angaria]|uniref:Apple domain-containing protein n=1 Tax=Caenorhabditis angaria TaxID=860376 RepID=A0A9P1IMF0_9PELO|nr:unnamed protein product [Caenorhabditis angaria]